jgi:hypothetical protein
MTRQDRRVDHEAPIGDRAVPDLVIALALALESAAVLAEESLEARV